MRYIKGYVFIANFRYKSLLFGRKIDDSNGNYNNIEGNGLIPYNRRQEAIEAGKEFAGKRKDLIEVNLGDLEMSIAENEEELSFFRRKSELIVVMKNTSLPITEERLLGPVVEGKLSFCHIPGAFLADTDFTTYTREKGEKSPFERAYYLGTEINRQAQSAATIAKFSLKRLQRIA